MDIIKVKANAQREIFADMLADALDIPEDVRKDLMEISDIQTDLFMRLRKDKALSHEAVKRYNELCYKHFGNAQDGGEFTKEEAPKAQVPEGMDFRQAWFEMLNGKKVKLPSWTGYWAWEAGTIMMHTKDGEVIDIRKTDNPAYTFDNVASHFWRVVEE